MVFKQKSKTFQVKFSRSSRSSSRSKSDRKSIKKTIFTKVQPDSSFTSINSSKTVQKNVMAQCTSNTPGDLFSKNYTTQFKDANTTKIYKLTSEDGMLDTESLNKQDKEAIVHNKVQRSIHPWCDGCYMNYVNVCKKVAKDWFIAVDRSGHFNIEKLKSKIDDYFETGDYLKLNFEDKIKHLWSCIYARYKQNVNCYRITSNEEKTNIFKAEYGDIRLVVEHSHNLFLTELCELYNKLVDKYYSIYHDNKNHEIFNCKVCLIHVDDNPVLSYFEYKKKLISDSKNVVLSRDTRKRK